MSVITIKTQEEPHNSTALINSPTLSADERERYRHLLDDIDACERLEDEMVAKNIRLAIAAEEPWDIL